MSAPTQSSLAQRGRWRATRDAGGLSATTLARGQTLATVLPTPPLPQLATEAFAC